MTCRWESLAARARGLGAHLLRDEHVRSLDRCTDVAELAHALAGTPYARFLGARTAEPEELEAALARSAAERLGTLARWGDSDRRCLAPILLEQDVDNVRAVLRGIVGAVSHDQRLAGTMPTPSLGRRALEHLAAAESTASVAATLVAWGHPLGSGLLEAAEGAHPDPFRMEFALARGLADAATAAAEAGGEAMLRFTRESLDAHNVVTALVLVAARHEGEPTGFFVEGGLHVSRDAFARAVASAGRPRCAELLADATRRTLFAAPLREPPASPAAVASRILAARIEDLGRRGRSDPLSALPAILFVLRLRLELRRLRRVLWRLALTEGGPG